MIRSNKGNCYITYVGDKICGLNIGKDTINYCTLLTSSVIKILIKNFPDKINEILKYVNDYPELVPFINEDPLLVCSLVDTNKTRWLVGDGMAYIQTPFYATENSTFSLVGKVQKYKGSSPASTQVLGYYTSSATTRSIGMHLRINSSTVAVCRFDGATATPYPSPEGSISEVYMDRYAVLVNGVESKFGNVSSFTSIMPMQIFRAGELGGGIIGITNVEFGGDVKAHFIPHIRPDGECGMLDIISCQFYSNANTSGQFAIEYTLQDGSPWILIG